MKRILYIVVVLLALATSACNSLLNVPFSSPKTGPTETFAINQPRFTGATSVEATLAPGTATLALGGGASGLAEGAVTSNVPDWKPILTTSATALRIAQRSPDGPIASAPNDAINQWDLKLGDQVRNVQIACPAGNFTLAFADSMPDDMTITVEMGAGNLRLTVPAGVAANVEVHRGPSSVATEGAWTAIGNSYATSGSGSSWTINVTMGVGNLTLASV
jgi:hypothetical protein